VRARNSDDYATRPNPDNQRAQARIPEIRPASMAGRLFPFGGPTMRSLVLSAALCSTLLVAGCATTTAATGAPPAASTSPATVESAPGTVAWAELKTPEERGHFMKTVVLPKMQATFANFDGEKFAKVTCGTCHGKGVADHTFKLPNPELPQLPSNEAGWADWKEHKGAWLEFMGKEVKPQMAALLGKPEFNPASPQPGAFGCMECHTMAAK
jgi:cytochrome c553